MIVSVFDLRLAWSSPAGMTRFQKCEARVYDYNSASISLQRKLGFVQEGRLRRHLFPAGGHHDEFVFGMTAEEFHELYPKLKPTL